MLRILKVSVVIALVAVLVAGLVTTAGCDTNGNPNGTQNGNVANGNESNGNESNGNEPTGPDLTSGFGRIIECGDTTAANLKAGDPAPDFTFQDAAGTTFSLSDFRGKQVFLNFWRVSCHWCVKEMPYIQQVYDERQGGDVVFLTINIADSAENVTEFMQENELSLPVLLDTEAKVAMQYLVNSYPRSFFIDEKGALQGMLPGAFQSAQDVEDSLDWLISR
jgi:peroxiredoxin